MVDKIGHLLLEISSVPFSMSWDIQHPQQIQCAPAELCNCEKHKNISKIHLHNILQNAEKMSHRQWKLTLTPGILTNKFGTN